MKGHCGSARLRRPLHPSISPSGFSVPSDTHSLCTLLRHLSGGAALAFRKCIEQVLLKHAKLVVNGTPPSSDFPEHKHRKALFDLCLPTVRLADAGRRAALECLFMSDLRSRSIDVFVAAGQSSLEEWARDAAKSLFPGAFVYFLEAVGVHRWRYWVKCVSLQRLTGCCAMKRSCGCDVFFQGAARSLN